MKVKQVVGEHKKGVRAKIYNKKGPEPRHVPKRKQEGPVATAFAEDATITKSGPEGVEITADDGIKTTLPADKATALAPDPQNPNEYDLNPAAINPNKGSSAETGPKVGAKVDMKAAEDASGLPEIPDSVTLDSADGFKDALRKAGEQVGVEPETLAGIDKIVVTDADGSVDVNATLKNTIQLMGEASVQFVQFYKDLLNAMIKGTQSPEFAQVDPEAKQSVIDAINDMKKQLPVFEREAAALQAQIQAANSNNAVKEAGEQVYYVKLLGNQNAAVKSGNGLTPIEISKKWDVLTPAIEEKARTQGFRKIMLSVNGALIPALEGRGRVIVSSEDYGTIISSQNEGLQRLQQLAGISETIEDLGQGRQKRTNPDGTYEIGDGSGIKLYSPAGKLLKIVSPVFNGFGTETDVASGEVTTKYDSGPLNVTQVKDKKGNVLSTDSNVDLGPAKLRYAKDRQGITTKEYTPVGATQGDMWDNAVTQKDLYAVGNKDKEATYDRAMKQVARESAELEAMLRIAGLR